MRIVTGLAARGGFVPDNLVCAGDLATSRPTPLMMWCTFADLGICWPSTVVKVDDTEIGIAEGLKPQHRRMVRDARRHSSATRSGSAAEHAQLIHRAEGLDVRQVGKAAAGLHQFNNTNIIE